MRISSDFIETLLNTTALSRGTCFAESDAGEGGGGEEAPTQDVEPEDVGAEEPEPGLQAEGEGAEGDDEEEMEPFEFNGKTYLGPKTLQAAILKDADYTNKTKELAERQRVTEETWKQREELATLKETASDDIRELKSLDVEFQKARKALADWRAVSPADWEAEMAKGQVHYDAARAAFDRAKDAVTDLGERINITKDSLNGKINELRTKETTARTEVTKRVEADLGKRIKGWDATKSAAVQKFAQDQGLSAATFQGLMSHPEGAVGIDLIYRAMTATAAMAKAVIKKPGAAVLGPAATKPAAPKPVTRVTGGAGKVSTAPSDDDDDSEWLRKRNAQLNRRPARVGPAASR